MPFSVLQLLFVLSLVVALFFTLVWGLDLANRRKQTQPQTQRQKVTRIVVVSYAILGMIVFIVLQLADLIP